MTFVCIVIQVAVQPAISLHHSPMYVNLGPAGYLVLQGLNGNHPHSGAYQVTLSFQFGYALLLFLAGS